MGCACSTPQPAADRGPWASVDDEGMATLHDARPRNASSSRHGSQTRSQTESLVHHQGRGRFVSVLPVLSERGSGDEEALPDYLRLPSAESVATKRLVRNFVAEVPAFAGAERLVEDTALRSVTLRELKTLVEHVKQTSHRWLGRRSDRGGHQSFVLLAPDTVSWHDLNLNFLVPLGSQYGVSYAEVFAKGSGRTPKVFVSHAWDHSVLQVYEVLKQHATDRGYTVDTPIWISALAVRQHKAWLRSLPPDLADASFAGAIAAADVTVAVVSSEDMGALGRSWCGLETYLSQVAGGAGHLTDIYTYAWELSPKGKRVEGTGCVRRLTDGFVPGDHGAALYKTQRDASFSPRIVQHALAFRLTNATASDQRDHEAILDYGRGTPFGIRGVDATVRAAFFVRALPSLAAAGFKELTLAAGYDAVLHSALRRLVIVNGDKVNIPRLVRALPKTISEVHISDSLVGPDCAELLANLLSPYAALRELDLHSNRIGARGAKAIGVALVANETLTAMNLSNNKLGGEGTSAIASAIKSNSALAALYLGYNKAGDEGAQAMADALRTNAAAATVVLAENEIGVAGMRAIAEALQANTAISSLDLSFNKAAADGAKALGDALQRNSTLREFKLGGNKIGSRGVKAIAEALQSNANVTAVHLEDNCIGTEGAKAMAKALQVNKCVSTLDFAMNTVGDGGAKAVAEALQANSTVTHLSLASNNIGAEGGAALASALQGNTTVARINITQNTVGDQVLDALRTAWGGRNPKTLYV